MTTTTISDDADHRRPTTHLRGVGTVALLLSGGTTPGTHTAGTVASAGRMALCDGVDDLRTVPGGTGVLYLRGGRGGRVRDESHETGRGAMRGVIGTPHLGGIVTTMSRRGIALIRTTGGER